jgi:hypothetical protein
MSYLSKSFLIPLIAATALLSTTACHSNSAQASADSAQASDPAAANLAQGSDNTGIQETASSAAPSNPAQEGPPPPDQGYADPPPQDQSSYDPGYGEQPDAYATQPPPPLPYYDQPQDPGDNYIWTPGYWAWAPMGYYWVPGAWVEAPYEGALWTPGYWGFWHHRYGFYRGYWGRHVGYYGGINYGFGYIGFGYEGGYWGGGHFNYNRSVNNINRNVERNVYSRPVGGGGGRGEARVSFNGGSGWNPGARQARRVGCAA